MQLDTDIFRIHSGEVSLQKPTAVGLIDIDGRPQTPDGSGSCAWLKGRSDQLDKVGGHDLLDSFQFSVFSKDIQELAEN